MRPNPKRGPLAGARSQRNRHSAHSSSHVFGETMRRRPRSDGWLHTGRLLAQGGPTSLLAGIGRPCPKPSNFSTRQIPMREDDDSVTNSGSRQLPRAQPGSSLPELMTVADFCRHFSISNTQVYREVAAGRLRIRKLGTATRISRADAQAWADALPIVARGA